MAAMPAKLTIAARLYERPAAPCKFLAANLYRLLAAQVARLFIGQQLRTVRIRLGSAAAIPGDGFYAVHTTTSFSSSKP